MASKSKPDSQAMTPERLRQIQELRRSNAAGPVRNSRTRAEENRRAIQESQ
jgi:hypothetical protein